MSTLDPELILRAHAAIAKICAGRIVIDHVDIEIDPDGDTFGKVFANAWCDDGGGAIVRLPDECAGVDLAALGAELTRMCSTSSRAAYALAGAIDLMRQEMTAATEALVSDLLGDMRAQVDGLVSRIEAKVSEIERRFAAQPHQQEDHR